ncbi:MAG: PQQ-binding-like beta-propeller repeat protein [Verrucomicrobiota bacterium]
MKLLYLCLALALPTPSLSDKPESSNWNQWRGPTRDGIIENAQPWPEGISDADFAPLWSIGLPESYAGPVISKGKLISVATREKKHEEVQAFDIASGQQLWKHEWEGAMKVPFFARANGSWVRCTPAIAGNAVYAGGMLDVLVKMELETGKEIWRVDFKEREGTQKPTFGYVSSPLVDETGDLYVQAGDAVTKLDPNTGKTVWRALEDSRGMFSSAFSSPVVANIHGVRQIVAQTRSTLGGLNPKTGDVLWSVPVEAFRGMNILTPTVIGNRVFTATYGGGAFMFDIEKSDDGTLAAKEAWKIKELEGYMASPIVAGNHLYIHGRDQHLHCLDISTGKAAWKSEQKFGKYWSMVANRNRILALDERGELIYFEATPEAFEIIGRRKISTQPTWAHLAVQGDRVYVRALKSLSAFRWKSEDTAAILTP